MQVVPARRGAIIDRHGVALAVSEPADDVSATPYLVKDPVRAAAKLAPLLGVDEGELVKKLARRDTGFVYLARRVAGRRRRRDQGARHRGHRADAGLAPRLPARRCSPPRCSAASALDGKGLFGLEYARRQGCCAAPTASASSVSDGAAASRSRSTTSTPRSRARRCG